MDYFYTVAEVEQVDNDIACGSCDWQGKQCDGSAIGSCALTPGDPSPACRCPECDSLAYVVEQSGEEAHSPLPWSLHLTGGTIGIKDANGSFVVRKATNKLPDLDSFNAVKKDFEFLVYAANLAPRLIEGGRDSDGGQH